MRSRARTILIAVLLVVPAQAASSTGVDAATVTGSWKATLGSNGTALLSLFDTGAGSLALALKGLPKSANIATAIRTGTCSLPLLTLATLPTYRSTSAGRLTKTRALSASVAGSIRAASSLAFTVRSGGFTRCAALKGGLVIPEGGFGAGTKLVGRDMKAGTYRTRAPSAGCYWARLSGLGGTLDEIIANDNLDGYAVVTISPSDVAFESTRCGVWSPDLSAVTKSRAAFGDGTFIVGTDMLPGRYRSAADVSGCYWARLSGFGGTLSAIIANDNVDGQAIVDIAAADAGFVSARCGTWTLVQ